jgi:hypothetical protein
MGNSYTPSVIGQDPWAASPRTAGPVGNGDYADPNSKMCRMKPHRNIIKDYVVDGQVKKKQECEKVKRELQDTYRIRDAFGDIALLKQAKENDWSVGEFDAKVKERLLGKPANGQTVKIISPMEINPENCRIKENWSIDKYRSEGLPERIYEADRAHEDAHKVSCQSLPSLAYNAAMSFPDKFSEDEVKAYTAKIKVLENWLQENCI